MNRQTGSPNKPRSEAIERAAWFARLAFGDVNACPEPRARPEPRKTLFEVLP